MKSRLLLILLALALTTVAFQPLDAQTSNPNVSIQYPLPVYLLSGAFTVRGTIALPDMNGYYLEFRPMVDANTPADSNIPWQPATLPANTPVINGVLGVWNTTTTSDGIYELRLTVVTTSGQFVYSRVAPLRVENHPQFGAAPTIPPAQPTIAIIPVNPTPSVSQQPQVMARVNANVRTGDSTLFPAIGALYNGQTAPVIGISTTGSGWWLIQLPDGRTGWIAPSTVQITGDFTRVPSISPPPPPTFTPSPTPTPTPQPLPDAVITSVRFDPAPVQGQPFHAIVTVFNLSPSALPRVSVACNFTPQNVYISDYLNGLNGFQQQDLSLNVQLNDGGGSDFTAHCAVDVNNLVTEISENNNFFNLTGSLANPAP